MVTSRAMEGEGDSVRVSVSDILKVYAAQVALLALLCFALFTTAYTVSETEQVVVFQFGKPVRTANEAGLYFKYPAPFQNVTRVEKRLFPLDAKPSEMMTKDKKLFTIDYFVLLQITDPVRYLGSVRTEETAKAQAETNLYGHLRNALGHHTLETINKGNRQEILATVLTNLNEDLKEKGMRATMHQLARVDLPEENKQSVMNRMKAERERIANQYRAEGTQENMSIVADADREVTAILAEAEKRSLQIRGEGDALAAKTYNEAYGSDPEFFRFYRGLEATRKSLRDTGQDTKIILNGTEPHLQAAFGK